MLQDPWPPGRTAERKRHDALRHVSTSASTPVFTVRRHGLVIEVRHGHLTNEQTEKVSSRSRSEKEKDVFNFLVENISSLDFS